MTMPRRSRFFLPPLRERTETVRSTMTTMRMRTPSMQAWQSGWNTWGAGSLSGPTRT